MIKLIANNKILLLNIDISLVINNPIFTEDNSFSYPGTMLKTEESESFFNYIGEISNSDASFRKIYCILQHEVISIEGVLYMDEAGDQYNFNFMASGFWDKAKNNKLSVLMEGYSKTFTSRAELKDTWLYNDDMIFAPLYNYKFNDGWPIGIRINELINDPDSFDRSSDSDIFVPFFKLDAILRKAANACGAKITINELESLADYQKSVIYNNFAINEFQAMQDVNNKKTIPIVYMYVNHPTSGTAEVMLPENAPAIASKFYMSQLEDPDGVIDNKTSEKTVSAKVTPQSIMRFSHTNDAYAYPVVKGFIEINTKITNPAYINTNPLVVEYANHGLNTGDSVYIYAPDFPLIHDQIFAIIKISNSRFSLPVDGTISGENNKIAFSSIDASGAPEIIFKTSESAWPDHLKVKHLLAITDEVYIDCPLLNIHGYFKPDSITDDYTFSILSAVTVTPGASKGTCLKVNFSGISYNSTIFAQRRTVHVIKSIKNTNPCEITFFNNHLLKDKSVMRIHNTGNVSIDDIDLTIELNGEDGIKLTNVDGSAFTPYNADLIGVMNAHPDSSAVDDHVSAPSIAWAELLQMKSNLNLEIQYANHMPDYTLAELITAVESKFCCKVLPNIFSNELQIRLLNKAVQNSNVKDITKYTGKDNIIIMDPVDGFNVINTEPEGDTYYPTMAPAIDYDKVSYQGSVANYANLPLTGNSINDMWLVANTQKLYIWQQSYSGTEEWKYLGYNIKNVYSGNKEFVMESGLSTFMHYGSHCRTDQAGTCKSVAPWVTVKPSLSIFMFNNPGGTNPHSSNGFMDVDNTITLFASGSKGTYEMLMKKYIEWYLNIRKGTQRIIEWEKDQITNFNFTDKFRINHQDYFVKDINVTLKPDGSVQWGVTDLYKA